MKKIYFGYLIAAIALVMQSCKKSEDLNEKQYDLNSISASKSRSDLQSYYWSLKQMIPLSEDTTSFIVLPEDSSQLLNKASAIKATGNFQRLRSGYYLVKNQRLSDFTKFIGNGNIQPVFRSKVKEQLIPTGEILVLPLPGVSIEEILKLHKAKLKIVSLSKSGRYIINVQNKASVLDVANAIYESGKVSYCHPNFLANIKSMSTDPLYGSQYWLKNTGQFGGSAGQDINVNDWAITDGLTCNIKVAVLDDGVEAHEELTGRLLTGYTPGYPSELGSPIASGAHGQATSGILAAAKDNSLGIAGVAPKAKIIPVNILRGGQSIADIGEGIRWAWQDAGADILSNSWGNAYQGTYFDDWAVPIQNARTLGRGGLGCLVVFSSGNQNGSWSGVTFPANLPGVVAVGASDKYGTILNYSSRGPEMDLVGIAGPVPGDMVTTDRNGSFGYDATNYTSTFNGTSATCPQVSGTAALMLSMKPDLTETQLSSILTSTATDMGPIGFDNTYGYGRLNVNSALSYVKTNYYSIIPAANYYGRICSNIPEYNNEYSINLPPGATIVWTKSPKLKIIGSTTSSVVYVNATTVNGTGVGTLTATITVPGCGSINTTILINLKNDCL